MNTDNNSQFMYNAIRASRYHVDGIPGDKTRGAAQAVYVTNSSSLDITVLYPDGARERLPRATLNAGESVIVTVFRKVTTTEPEEVGGKNKNRPIPSLRQVDNCADYEYPVQQLRDGGIITITPFGIKIVATANESRLDPFDVNSSAFLVRMTEEFVSAHFTNPDANGDDLSTPATPIVVLANTHRDHIRSLYVGINGIPCQVQVAHNSNMLEYLRVLVRDADGTPSTVDVPGWTWNDNNTLEISLLGVDWVFGTKLDEVTQACTKYNNDIRQSIKRADLPKEIERATRELEAKISSLKLDLEATKTELDATKRNLVVQTKAREAAESNTDATLKQQTAYANFATQNGKQEFDTVTRLMDEMQTRHDRDLERNKNDQNRIFDLYFKQQQERNSREDRLQAARDAQHDKELAMQREIMMNDNRRREEREEREYREKVATEERIRQDKLEEARRVEEREERARQDKLFELRLTEMREERIRQDKLEAEERARREKQEEAERVRREKLEAEEKASQERQDAARREDFKFEVLRQDKLAAEERAERIELAKIAADERNAKREDARAERLAEEKREADERARQEKREEAERIRQEKRDEAERVRREKMEAEERALEREERIRQEKREERLLAAEREERIELARIAAEERARREKLEDAERIRKEKLEEARRAEEREERARQDKLFELRLAEMREERIRQEKQEEAERARQEKLEADERARREKLEAEERARREKREAEERARREKLEDAEREARRAHEAFLRNKEQAYQEWLRQNAREDREREDRLAREAREYRLLVEKMEKEQQATKIENLIKGIAAVGTLLGSFALVIGKLNSNR